MVSMSKPSTLLATLLAKQKVCLAIADDSHHQMIACLNFVVMLSYY